ncbi:hypothetical protein DW66_2601 [Pseudomonas putida]|nr:hypothetical protein DW66_2601 [Pseudomonas putida]
MDRRLRGQQGSPNDFFILMVVPLCVAVQGLQHFEQKLTVISGIGFML